MKAKSSLKFLVISTIYTIIMIDAFIFVPSNPDDITAPISLVNEFRIMSMLTMTIFWIVLGITFGLIWNKLKPHETTQFKTV
jgi:predicted cobalt transporter CbtA